MSFKTFILIGYLSYYLFLILSASLAASAIYFKLTGLIIISLFLLEASLSIRLSLEKAKENFKD